MTKSNPRKEEVNMREYSKISPRLWLDQKFRTLSDDAKMAFVWALTCPAQNSTGAFRGNELTLAAECGWSTERARTALEGVAAVGMIECDSAAFTIVAPNFLRYNMPTSPGAAKCLGRLFSELPECGLRNSHLERVCNAIGLLSEEMRTAFSDGVFDALGVRPGWHPDGIGDGIHDGIAMVSRKHPRSKEQRTKNKEKGTRSLSRPAPLRKNSLQDGTNTPK